jgi:hypothetical protein
MPTYEDLMELANICARHAQAATDPDVAIVLSKMAREYRTEAAKLESGNSRDVCKSARCP